MPTLVSTGQITRSSAARIFHRAILLSAALMVTITSPSGHAQETGSAAPPTVIISELMSSNESTLRDEDGKAPDWIELHNYGSKAVNLKGLVLVDGKKKPTRWTIPDLVLEPGAYGIIFASGKDRSVSGHPLHANFKLSAKGDHLALLASDGSTVLQEFLPKYPSLASGTSYGIGPGWRSGQPTAAHARLFLKPTPGAPNTDGLLGEVAEVKLSRKRGLCDQPFDLELSTRTDGAEIRYTIDGSEPTGDRGSVYRTPIPISLTTVLRVVASKPDHRASRVKTHTFIFPRDVITQSPDGLPPAGFPFQWGMNQVDYGMDPRIVEDPRYREQIVAGLESLPSFSIVAGIDSLFGAKNGVYSNPGEQGRESEREVSLEMISADGTSEFQIDCGLRMRGGFSRSAINPKHAFRLFFRDEYGEGKLKFPLFGRDGAQEFENLDLRTFQNYSWSLCGDPRATFLRDQFNRDLQRAMGHPTARGNFCHLYVNGQYWGLYNTCERPEASFGGSYLGGKKSDYDAVKVDSGFTTRQSTYTTISTDGNLEAWTRLYEAAAAGLTENSSYFALQGRDPDGAANPALENLLDVDNLIDYMLLIFWGGNLDAPISSFGDNRNPNNFHALRRRNGTEGFRYFIWDAEHTMLALEEDRTGPFNTGERPETRSPQWLWQQCVGNAEFRLRVADRVQRHFHGDGVLSPASLTNRFTARAHEIEAAVIAESARWGDVKHTIPMGAPPRVDKDGRARTGPLNRDDDWRPEIHRLVTDYLPRRSAIVEEQLFAQGLIPDVPLPEFRLPSGGGARQVALAISPAPAGAEIFVTTDGTDPRLVGGQISPKARKYTEALPVPGSGPALQARTLLAGDWSALSMNP